MIDFVNGNNRESFWDMPADARVNTINCVGVMGKGIALEFATRYPGMLGAYKAICKSRILKPGNVWMWKEPAVTIFNVATKDDWRFRSRYEWIKEGLTALRDLISYEHCQHVVMPAIGCGNGGLDWNDVRELIIVHLIGLNARVTVFEPSTREDQGT